MEMSSRWQDVLSLRSGEMSWLESVRLRFIHREIEMKAVSLDQISYKVEECTQRTEASQKQG